MESGKANPSSSAQLRSSSYTKLNDWSSSGANKRPFTASRSTLARWKCVFVGTVVVCCVAVIGFGIGFGLSNLGAKNNQKTRGAADMTASTYERAAVACQTAVCAEIGRDILLKGGSAVDAAIAAMICEGANSPQSVGLGGGFFAVVYSNETKKAEVIDARETAPLKATEDMYDADPSSKKAGGMSVAVPGELRGYWMAHERHGNLSWSELFEPTIKLCEEGIVVSKRVEYALWEKVHEEVLNEPTMKSLFFNNETNELVRAGDVIKMPELARTMRAVAEKGAEELYVGELAVKLVEDIKAFGGIITLKDLQTYQPLIREPITLNLSESLTLYTMPPPGSGLLLGLIIKLLDGLGLRNADVEQEIRTNHLFVEACKFSFAKRPEIADPDFADMTNLTDLLTSAEFVDKIRAAIDETKTHDTKYYESVYGNEPDHGTAHVSVLAPNGDAVSMTSTVNLWFGALIRSPSTGIILNDEMDDFATNGATNFYGLLPSRANFIAPYKRPASSMAPALVIDSKSGDVRYVFGSAGGIKIISTTAYAFMLHHLLNEDVGDAVSSPRIHSQLHPNVVEYEPELLQAVLEGLKKKGHRLEPMAWTAAANMIYHGENADKMQAACDPRRHGRPAGF